MEDPMNADQKHSIIDHIVAVVVKGILGIANLYDDDMLLYMQSRVDPLVCLSGPQQRAISQSWSKIATKTEVSAVTD